MPTSTWTPDRIPDLDGRSAVVTGATSGIGRTTAAALARRGAHVVLAVRDTARGEAVAQAIGGSAEVRALDLADLASVRAFADGWTGRIDLLINNAGIMAVPYGRTRDGFESQFGTNHLGHFALTNLLLERVTGRVVTLSSHAHRMGQIRFEDLHFEQPGSYDRWRAYGQSKLANLLFATELQRRLAAAGSDVLSIAVHPGYVATNLQSRTGSRLQHALMKVTNRLIAIDDERGSWNTLYAATSPDVEGGAYIAPQGLQELRGEPGPGNRSAAAQDAAAARRLWDVSEALTGTRFPLGARAAA